MKRVLMAVALVLFPLTSSSLAGEKEAIGRAKAAAGSWLALTDSAKYGESWDQASSLFKAAITKADWEKTVKGVRVPLGTVKSRKIKSATFSRTLPGARDGEYVVIQFNTRFENKAAAIETVTPMHEKDGSWRVSGYFIK
jgi:hypothetical protein